MKIIKKSELKECECECCHSIVKPDHKNLTYHSKEYVTYKTYWECPLCKHYNEYKF